MELAWFGSPYASGKPPVANTHRSLSVRDDRIQRSAARSRASRSPPVYGDEKSEKPTTSTGELGAMAQAKRALSAALKAAIEMPIWTFGSICFAARDASVMYASQRATGSLPSSVEPMP